jgi:hypothetical protein
MFRLFAATTASRAPLYSHLSAAIADDPATARVLLHAPPTQRLPVLLFACVHWLLITEPQHRLRRFYPNLADRSDGTDRTDGADPVDIADLWPEFRRFVAENEPRIAGLLATRSTQTNEVGRCATFVPALAELAEEVGALAHLDVGASAGLNLLLDRYHYRYGRDDGSTVDVGGPSAVVIECATRGPVPLPRSLPPIIDRVGLDRSPVDIDDPQATTWLQACVWPDQADRFERLGAALGMARSAPPPIVTGDAIDHLVGTAERLDPAGHLVVTNSWVLNYLDEDRRREYVGQLDRLGTTRDLTWCFAESPLETSGLPYPDDIHRPDRTHLLRVDWRGGRRTVRHLAAAHPHGFWLHWN